ncbi:uncharacterized protein ACA1_249760 [Acanthamoeba castellanii str. Neff]|uniref:Uncharacterized protein n=1 Tax=Acanthamoeba castellanii (strain ATCC 30010 / Neff) TaxID=1257118 RepID=L8HD27_ACACF|nr:uncharacterized protein ACA1_249760 [Acanthamoeba castellanii str. Neff]ELR23122.1 hypothetical protein ACA1_249760 [Acanthamoeba castellanii str. Neff]
MVQINSFLFQFTPHYFHLHHYYLTSTCTTKKCGKGKAEEEKSPSTIKHKAELALQKKYLPQFTKSLTKLLGQPTQFHEWPVLIYLHDFTIHSVDIPLNIEDAATCLSRSYSVRFYISSSPSNIANAITSLKSHSTLQVFHLLHFYYSSPTYSHSMPTSKRGFDVLIFSHKRVNMLPSGILWPATPSPNPSAICTTSPSHTQCVRLSTLLLLSSLLNHWTAPHFTSASTASSSRA